MRYFIEVMTDGTGYGTTKEEVEADSFSLEGGAYSFYKDNKLVAAYERSRCIRVVEQTALIEPEVASAGTA